MACGILLGVFEGVGVLLGRVMSEGQRPPMAPCEYHVPFRLPFLAVLTRIRRTSARHTRTFTMRKLIPCTFVDGFHFVVMIMTNIHHPSSLPTQIKDMFCHMSYHCIIRRTPLRILDYSCCVCLYLLSLSLIHRCRRSTHATWIVFHTLKSSMALGLI